MEQNNKDGKRFIVAGSFIDGCGTSVRRNIFLAVKDGVIADIGSALNLPHNDNNTIDDFSHCTIVPALVDCSVSLSRSPSVDSKVRLSSEDTSFVKKGGILENHIRYCHSYGVQGVADNDDTTGQVKHYLKEIADESIIDIKTSGTLLRSRQDFNADNLTASDFIKVRYSSNIEDRKASHPCLNYKDLGHVLQRRGGKKAVVIANGPRQVKEAIEAGCDAIEQGYVMGEDNLRKMAKKNVLWIPNVLRAKNGLDSAGSGGDVCCRFSQRYVAPGKPDLGAEVFWKKMLAEQLTQLHLARKLAVTTAVGSGAGSIGILHGESMVEEMKLFIKAGYSLEETIRCATENGAKFFGMEKLGSLIVGQKATFLIARGTVQQLPRKLSYLKGIYVEGVPSDFY